MKGLTAKVFRTFNASNTLQNELEKSVDVIKKKDGFDVKLEFYDKANK